MLRVLTTALIVLLCWSFPTFGAVDSSYDKLVMDEIEYNRKLKLLEKETEVLVRMKQFDAPTTYVSSASSSALYSANKNSNKYSTVQKTEVS